MKGFVWALLFASACDAPMPSEGESVRAVNSSSLPNNFAIANATGRHATYTTSGGSIDLTGPFFQSLGTNGRTCGSCHVPADGWTITPSEVQQRFDSTGGTDPIFRGNDGSNAPNLDVSTVEARRSAYSMLLTKGLIRVGIGIPSNAEFTLAAVDDPYHYAGAAELSLFRRPLPSTNLRFLSSVMWDGRETAPKVAIADDLRQQARDATLGHAQATAPPSDAQLSAIVDFESALFTTQVYDDDAHELDARQALGNPQALSAQTFYIGINDNLGDAQTKAPFSPVVFTIFNAWSGAAGGGTEAARAAVVRGQTLFNSKHLSITGVGGLNDNPDLGSPAVIDGTCSTCHDTPSSGNHSVALPVDIGISAASRRTPDLPLYTLENKTTHRQIQTTDPGRALVTGLWNDIGRFKGPILRGLAARPPYFHNGSAATLADVVDFYNGRFSIGLSAAEKSDLVAFLKTL